MVMVVPIVRDWCDQRLANIMSSTEHYIAPCIVTYSYVDHPGDCPGCVKIKDERNQSGKPLPGRSGGNVLYGERPGRS